MSDFPINTNPTPEEMRDVKDRLLRRGKYAVPLPFTATDAYDRNKTKRQFQVRRLTEAEIRTLQPGQRIHFLDNNGQVRELTINGKVRTWKTDPIRLEIPAKYGLREYAVYSLAEALDRFVVVLEVIK